MEIVVRVDPEKCMASGVCVALGPDFFDLGEAGYAVPKPAPPGADRLEVLREAEASCPTAAITVEVTVGRADSP